MPDQPPVAVPGPASVSPADRFVVKLTTDEIRTAIHALVTEAALPLRVRLERRLHRIELKRRGWPAETVTPALAYCDHGYSEGEHCRACELQGVCKACEPVSPADTIRRALWHSETCRYKTGCECGYCAAQDALAALLAVGERDRRQIARLTAALERIASEPPDKGLTPNFREFARAVLADEEDART